MFGDLVRVELFVGPITSFNPLFANFKLGKRLWEGKKDNIRMSIWVSGISLTLPVTTVFSGHSDKSIENETKVHCVSKTDCLVSRVSAVLPDPCLACNGPAESRWQTWERHIIQRAGWLRRLRQGARKGRVDGCIMPGDSRMRAACTRQLCQVIQG